MKLPSVGQIVHGAGTTFLRFPFTVLDAVVGTVVAFIIVGEDMVPGPKYLLNIVLATILGIPFLTGLVIAGEKRKFPPVLLVVFQVAGAILLVAYWIVLPPDLTSAPGMHIARFFLLLVAMHLFVSVLPFSAKGESNGFWHFNRILFLRFLVSVLFSAVLFAGLAFALGALQHLFGLDVPAKRYAQLWVIIAGLFCTIFFLAGVPGDLDALNRRSDYPKGLKIFAQYILLPIVVVYLVILYAYAAKIIVQWEWPKGWVSGLTLGFSTAGILSFLLLHPVRELSGNVWIGRVSRWFYVALFPLIAMLLLAIWRRVSEYGLTEGRYIVIVLGLWLAAIACYFLFSKARSIKVIPASLCAVAFVVSVGPWGMFSVAENNQVARLKGLLEKNRILVDGGTHAAPVDIPFDDRRNISSILSYLSDMHGYEKIQPWFSESLRSAPDDPVGRWTTPQQISVILGIQFVDRWQTLPGRVVSLRADAQMPIDPRGYRFLIPSQSLGPAGDTLSLRLDGVRLMVNRREAVLGFVRVVDGRGIDTLRIPLRDIARHAADTFGTNGATRIPPDDLSVSGEDRYLSVRVVLLSAQMLGEAEGLTLSSCEASLFVTIKE